MKPGFTLLRDPNLQEVAAHAVKLCRVQNANLGPSIIERPISTAIPWVPTFRFGSSSKGMRAFEVCRTLQPDALLASLPFIIRTPYPISAAIVVPVELTQGSGAHRDIDQLHENSVSVLTIDDSHHLHNRLVCPPVAQHITSGDWRTSVAGLPPKFRGAFYGVHTTYQTSVVQGVQQAGQIVEAIVNAGVGHAIEIGKLPSNASQRTLARKIDALWEEFPRHRANLAAARVFASRYRNPSSHPPSSPQGAVKRIMQAKAAMLEAVTTTAELLAFLKALAVPPSRVQLP